jgi:hypothetical protein
MTGRPDSASGEIESGFAVRANAIIEVGAHGNPPVGLGPAAGRAGPCRRSGWALPPVKAEPVTTAKASAAVTEGSFRHSLTFGDRHVFLRSFGC